jgi:hypothetical protein
LPILVDAKAVLGAAANGRTSAPGIRGTIRHIGALAMATNSLLKLIYVPTEHNPADAPSRGVRTKRRRRPKSHTNKSRSALKLDRSINSFLKYYEDLDDMLSRHL